MASTDDVAQYQADAVMIYHPLPLSGAYLVELQKRADPRGFFARTWCQREFVERGLNANLVQCNVSWNERKRTLRGMHFQTAPHAEAKLVRCTRGAIYDVIIDLRPGSPTCCRWFGTELTHANHHALYVPEGFAHGFQCLEDGCEVFYQMSEFYHPECASGVRWNDAAFAIRWPLPDPILSEKDQLYPDFSGMS